MGCIIQTDGVCQAAVCVGFHISRVLFTPHSLCSSQTERRGVADVRGGFANSASSPMRQCTSLPPSLTFFPLTHPITLYYPHSTLLTHSVSAQMSSLVPVGFFFFNLLLVKLTGIQFQHLNPMTQVSCQLDSPCNGQWKKIRFIFYSLILIYWWNCEVILTSAPFSVLVCSHFFL